MHLAFSNPRTRARQEIFLCLVLMVSLAGLSLPGQETARISKFGVYKGFSEDVYDSWVRSSQYLTMRDGVKLAIDIIRPAKNGQVETQPLPVIWTHTRYRRAFIHEGKVISEAASEMVQPLIKHGYVSAAVDVRGSGASFGSFQGVFTKEETQDAYEITEWLASQPWSNGNIGMWGGSYLGITQLMAAGTKPPHLKAIFPIVALFDIYGITYHGGVLIDDFLRTWSELTRQLDTQVIAAPVDEDKDGSLLKSAIEQHKLNRPLIDAMGPLQFRDSKDPVTGAYPYKEWHPAGLLKEINESGVPMYLWCGWFDSFTKDGFLMYRNFTSPKKIVMGAWSHSPRDKKIAEEEFGLGKIEFLRWFDYWLKGIDNGIMAEPPIRYQTMKTAKGAEWKTASQWPIPEEKPQKYYFFGGPSGSLKSGNDGLLKTTPAEGSSGWDQYTVDYTTTTGQTTRWDNAVGGGFGYPDMTPNDQKGLTYTTAPLEKDTEMTGHPAVHLWVNTTANDGDFFVYLEDVDDQGSSHYLTEGVLRASHRALHEPPYDNLGLPYHRSYEEDVKELAPGEPVELVFELQPTSNVFLKGHRIRITLACADIDNAATPKLSPPPTVTIYRESGRPSYVSLPVGGAPAEPKSIFLAIIFIVLGVIVLTIVFTMYLKRKTK